MTTNTQNAKVLVNHSCMERHTRNRERENVRAARRLEHALAREGHAGHQAPKTEDAGLVGVEYGLYRVRQCARARRQQLQTFFCCLLVHDATERTYTHAYI